MNHSRKQLEEMLIEAAKTGAAWDFLANGGIKQPVVLAVKDGRVQVIGSCGFDEDTKDDYAKVLVQLAKTCSEMCFIVEAWVKTFPSMDKAKTFIGKGARISSDPQKLEYVFVHYLSPIKSRTFQAKIVRPANSPALLEKWQESSMEQISGRFANIYQKARQHERN